MKPSRTGFDKTRQHKTQQIHCPENAGLLKPLLEVCCLKWSANIEDQLPAGDGPSVPVTAQPAALSTGRRFSVTVIRTDRASRVAEHPVIRSESHPYAAEDWARRY